MHFACRAEEVDKIREKEGGLIFKGFASLPKFPFFKSQGKTLVKIPMIILFKSCFPTFHSFPN